VATCGSGFSEAEKIVFVATWKTNLTGTEKIAFSSLPVKL
jgi:hypothetical protein